MMESIYYINLWLPIRGCPKVQAKMVVFMPWNLKYVARSTMANDARAAPRLYPVTSTFGPWLLYFSRRSRVLILTLPLTCSQPEQNPAWALQRCLPGMMFLQQLPPIWVLTQLVGMKSPSILILLLLLNTVALNDTTTIFLKASYAVKARRQVSSLVITEISLTCDLFWARRQGPQLQLVIKWRRLVQTPEHEAQLIAQPATSLSYPINSTASSQCYSVKLERSSREMMAMSVDRMSNFIQQVFEGRHVSYYGWINNSNTEIKWITMDFGCGRSGKGLRVVVQLLDMHLV